MKFNREITTNQRIDRITTKTAVVGIDIAKDVHAARITDFRKRTLTPRHLSFSNDIHGFEKLMAWIQKTQSQHGLASVIVGLEPTGHYWFNLANWLLERGIPVVLVNPVLTHRSKENRDNSPSKNDPKDALIIADLVNDGCYTEYRPQAEELERLKTLMTNREFWADHLVSVTNYITRWIDLYFPEFRRVFKDWKETERAIATLRLFPLPCDLKGRTAEEIVEAWRSQGMKRPGGARGKAIAAELLRAAERSIGYTRAPAEARQAIRDLIEEYERVKQRVEGLKEEIRGLVDLIPMARQLRSIPGLGPLIIAALLAFGGDLGLYRHGRQLLRKAGLNLAERKSGKYQGQIKISKRGDSLLRKYLYLGTCILVKDNAEFKQMHAKNLGKGMKKMASIMKCIGKLARIVVGMARHGESYRPEKWRQPPSNQAA